MTNKERLISLLGFAPPVNSAEGALLDAGISETGLYDGSNKDQLKTIAIELMQLLLTTADTENTTTGFQVKYDRGSILKRIKALQDELGITSALTPTIKGVRVW